MPQPETYTEQDRFDQERSELNALLESPLFSRAPSLRSFLSYVCEQHFGGKAEDLKEYNIAVEALGRNPGFDHTRDSIVRVEAHKLRKRLKEFYENEGADHRIHIEIPPGQYAPNFVSREQGPPQDQAVKALVRASDGTITVPDAGVPAWPESRSIPAEEAANARFVVSPRRRIPLFVGTAALVAAGLALVAAIRLAEGPGTATDTVRPGLGSEVVYRISCGSPITPYVDDLGITWGDDRFFEGGQAVEDASATIEGTWSQSIFRTRREGASFSYAIPLDPGTYEVHLHFAETVYGPNNPGTGESSRIFHVDANGRRILSSFDVLSDAGRPNAAATKVFAGLQPDQDGLLRLSFTAVSSTAMINGIEVFRAPSHQPLPVRILAGDRKSALIDKAGQNWGPDRYFFGGRSVPRMNPILNTPDPSLFSAERYGNFRYVIPVADGVYTVRLHFAETWWGNSNPGGAGEGSRVFNVQCNGMTLLKGFDVYREAGGENRALLKTFHGIKPNPQSRIELSFIPSANYAVVNAIEVFAQ